MCLPGTVKSSRNLSKRSVRGHVEHFPPVHSVMTAGTPGGASFSLVGRGSPGVGVAGHAPSDEREQEWEPSNTAGASWGV